jgi:hypothetical protein
MNPSKLIGVILIVAGVLALLYGGFSFTKETHDFKLGPIELSVKEKESVNVPIWAGVGLFSRCNTTALSRDFAADFASPRAVSLSDLKYQNRASRPSSRTAASKRDSASAYSRAW